MVTHQAAATPRSVACPKALPQTDLFVLSTSTRFCVCVSLFSLIFQTVPTGHFMPRAILAHLAKHIKSGGVEIGVRYIWHFGRKKGQECAEGLPEGHPVCWYSKLTVYR